VLLNCETEIEEQQPLEWETELAPPELADRWILSRFNRVALEVGDALAEYRLHEAATQIYHFFWGDFCDWYIELTKPYVTATEARPEDRAVKRRLMYMLERSLRLLHPIMPYITEELWQRLPHGGETLSRAEYPQANAAQLDGRAEREMSFVIELVTKLRNIRSTFNIAPSTPLTARVATGNEESRDVLAQMEGHIKRLAKINQLEIVAQLTHEQGSARAVVGEAEIEVPLAGLIDFDKERERLARELSKLEGELSGMEKRLANAEFIERAAPDVVAETKARAAEREGQIGRLKAMIASL
jgi:valyl-tRNA synthetase